MSGTAMPARLGALHLTLGKTTRRCIEICSNDAEHTVVTDAFTRFDKECQAHVFDEDLGDPVCYDCNAPLEMMDLDVLNAEAIERMRAALKGEITSLEVCLDRPLPSTLTRKGSQPSQKGDWLREVCDQCGEETAQIDAYATYDPLTDDCEIITTFDKGHCCTSCGADGIRPEQKLLSSHEVLGLLGDIRLRAENLRGELLEIDQWLAAHGQTYGMSKARCAELAVEATLVRKDAAA